MQENLNSQSPREVCVKASFLLADASFCKLAMHGDRIILGIILYMMNA